MDVLFGRICNVFSLHNHRLRTAGRKDRVEHVLIDANNILVVAVVTRNAEIEKALDFFKGEKVRIIYAPLEVFGASRRCGQRQHREGEECCCGMLYHCRFVLLPKSETSLVAYMYAHIVQIFWNSPDLKKNHSCRTRDTVVGRGFDAITATCRASPDCLSQLHFGKPARSCNCHHHSPCASTVL